MQVGVYRQASPATTLAAPLGPELSKLTYIALASDLLAFYGNCRKSWNYIPVLAVKNIHMMG